MNNEMMNINLRLAKLDGLNIEVESDGTVFGQRDYEGDNVLKISAPIDYSKDWNLLIPLGLKYGLFGSQPVDENDIDKGLEPITEKQLAWQIMSSIISTAEERARAEHFEQQNGGKEDEID